MAEMEQPHALVFDVSSPDRIARARWCSPCFDATLCRLQKDFGVSPEWPGCDLIALDSRGEVVDRLIELKSSGVDAHIQEMTWNEWQVAAGEMRSRFFLYLVGNLRSDPKGSVPFVRTVRDPFGQLAFEVRVNWTVQRKVQLVVHLFRQAEHLDLTVVPTK